MKITIRDRSQAEGERERAQTRDTKKTSVTEDSSQTHKQLEGSSPAAVSAEPPWFFSTIVEIILMI